MKVIPEPIMYTCLTTELDAGKPPLVDDDGLPIRDGSMCEVLDDVAGTVVSTFLMDDSAWYEY